MNDPSHFIDHMQFYFKLHSEALHGGARYDERERLKMTRKMGISVLFIGILLLVGVLAGCSRAAETPTPQPTAPPAAREPKRLEAKVTIVMGDMFLADDHGTRGGTFRVPAGKTVGIHFVNQGAIEHEVLFGRVAKHEGDVLDGYETSLFENVPIDAFVYPGGKKVEVATAGMLEEIELEPGADAWVRVKFPEGTKGTWEIGCFVPGHYEAGMKATLIIE